MDREKVWKNAKDIFVALVLKEAPNSFGKEKLVAGVINRHDSALVQGCGLLDSIEDQFASCDNNVPVEKLDKILGNFVQNSQKLSKNIETMTTSLRVAIEHYKDERAPGTPKMKEALVRGLKVLKTSLVAIDKTNEAWIQTSQDRIKGRRERLDSFKTMSDAYLGVLKAAVARGLAAAQRLKSNPAPKSYNTEFPKAARDIYQQVNNVKVLVSKGVPPPGPKDISKLAEGLQPFAVSPHHTVDLNATPAQVLELISKFNKAVKAVAVAYEIQ